MKCPHCGAEVVLKATGVYPTLCPSCGQSIASPGPRLVVQPRDESPTVTETLLGFIAWLCIPAAVFLAVLAFGSHSDNVMPLLAVAGALFINGLFLMAMKHALRYLRLTVNSLGSMRAKPLGAEDEE